MAIQATQATWLHPYPKLGGGDPLEAHGAEGSWAGVAAWCCVGWARKQRVALPAFSKDPGLCPRVWRRQLAAQAPCQSSAGSERIAASNVWLSATQTGELQPGDGAK